MQHALEQKQIEFEKAARAQAQSLIAEYELNAKRLRELDVAERARHEAELQARLDKERASMEEEARKRSQAMIDVYKSQVEAAQRRADEEHSNYQQAVAQQAKVRRRRTEERASVIWIAFRGCVCGGEGNLDSRNGLADCVGESHHRRHWRRSRCWRPRSWS